VELIRHVAALRVLCALGGAQSFSAAAAELGISQSAVSQHVAALERQVGLQLVQRDTRPVDLTPAGVVLAEHGAAVLARLEAASEQLAEIAGQRSRRLRVGGFPTSLATFVPAALRLLSRRLPDLSLVVVDDHVQGLIPRLLRHELDVAVVFDDSHEPELSNYHEIELTHLMVDRYRLLLPRSHPLARSTRDLDLADLANQTWVGGAAASTWFQIVRRACRTAGFDPRVALASDDHVAVQAFVAAELGIAVVPGLVTARRVPGVQVRELRGECPTREILAARPAGPFASEAATTIITLLQEVTSQMD
jgi:DNA-binding transcriptional LysR family regulator